MKSFITVGMEIELMNHLYKIYSTHLNTRAEVFEKNVVSEILTLSEKCSSGM